MNDRFNLNQTVTPLNRKAMLARLVINMPTTVARDTQAEQFTQQSLADNALRVSVTRFASGPLREILNAASQVRAVFKNNTLPFEDGGDRLLPVGQYEICRDRIKAARDKLDALIAQHRPNYAKYVADDIARRGSRASPADYPSEQEFFDSLRLTFRLRPMPDTSHFLFDVSEEDKQAMVEQFADVERRAKDEMMGRLRDPLRHLLDKLRIPVGEKGSIFRDSAVQNVIEAVADCRRMAMDDPEILAACDEIQQAFTGHARNPQVLRESPIVREQMVDKLRDIQSKMGWMISPSEPESDE